GKRDRAAAAFNRRLRDCLRRGAVLHAIKRARFRNVPVLAELAGQVATRRAEGQHRRAGEKVIERLLLNRIDAKAGGAAVRGEQDLVVLARAHEAHAALAVLDVSMPRGRVALGRATVAREAAVVQSMPVAARHAVDDRLIHFQAGVNSGAILYPHIWVAGEVAATVEKASQRTKIRPPAAAGLFYAGHADRL